METHYEKYGKKCYERNKGRWINTRKAWNAANPGKRVEYVQAYVARNPEKVADYNRRFSQTLEGKYRGITHRHKKRGWADPFLSIEEYAPLFAAPCRYCDGSTRGGLDRVDNDRGYNLDNVVPCCEVCNHMKWKLSRDEFLNHITKIYAQSH